MQHIKSNQAKRFKNSQSCIAFEYPLGDSDIDATIIKIAGRYPERGRVLNRECKEIVYIVSGSGIVEVEGQEIQLVTGDMVLIQPCERFFWDGEMELVVSCTPAWNLEQYKQVC